MPHFVVPALCALALLAAGSASSGPPPVHISAPGPTLGETRSEWLLPYVRYEVEGVVPWNDEPCNCCPVGVHSVTWFSAEGKVLRDVRDVSRCAGFLQSQDNVIGLWPHWEMPEPRKGVGDGYICATPTGHVFVHQYHPSEREVAVDVYHEGRLVRTIGPYPGATSYPARICPNDSGAAVLLTGDPRSPQV
jgi:hypothetical protein